MSGGSHPITQAERLANRTGRCLFRRTYRPPLRRWFGLSAFAGARLGVLVSAAVIVAPRTAGATDAIEPIGISMQSRMRGGADVAVGDSALSQIDNPATLSLSPRGMYALDQASKLAILDLPRRGPLGTARSERKLIHLHNLGLAMPVDDRLTFGLALHSKAGLGTRFHQRHLMIPFMKRRVHSDMKVMAFNLSAACQLTDKLSLGGARISDLKLPQKITAGAAWDVTDWFKLVGEVRWMNYADGTFNSMTIATDGVVDGYVLAFRESLEGPGYGRIPLGFDYGVSESRPDPAHDLHRFRLPVVNTLS